MSRDRWRGAEISSRRALRSIVAARWATVGLGETKETTENGTRLRTYLVHASTRAVRAVVGGV